MSIVVYDLAFVITSIIVCGVCGWWVIAPLRRHFAYAPSVAPLAGLVLMPISTLALHVGLGIALARSGVAAAVLLAGASLFIGLAGRPRELDAGAVGRAALRGVIAVLFTAAWSVWWVMPADRFFGGPGLMYVHGTDHLGYAHIADWMQMHQGNIGATLDPTDWYASWPSLLYAMDPRFGSFTLLSLISMAAGRPASFAYDLCSAVVIAIGALGIAGLFARRPLTFALLTFGVLSGYGFDWSRGGYLAKVFSYPASILTAALFIAWARDVRARTQRSEMVAFVGTAAIAAGAALAFSGLVTSLFLLLLGGTFLVFEMWFRPLPSRRRRAMATTTCLVGLGLLAALSILSGGIFARPLFFAVNTPLPWSWPELLARVAEFDGLIPGRTLFSPSAVWILTLAQLALWAVVGVLAFTARVPLAAAFLVAPLLLLAGLFAKDLRWHAMNFISLFGTPALCGAIALVDALHADQRARWARRAVTLAIVVMIAWHLPRFWATASLHGGPTTPAAHRFSAQETDRLASAILREGGSAVVDVGDNPQFAVFLLVEMGRRGVPLEWSDTSWRRAMGYRPWPAPKLATPPPLRIRVKDQGGRLSAPLVLVTTQFELRREGLP